MIGGEWLRLVPGMPNVSLGFAADQQGQLADYLGQSGLTMQDLSHQLSPERQVDIPAMLVATRAMPASEEILGRVSLTTRILRAIIWPTRLFVLKCWPCWTAMAVLIRFLNPAGQQL